MKNYRFIIQYDGTRYKGWQKQGNTDETIQGKLEAVLGRLAGEPVEVHGSGRTDAGVHALGQVANAHLETALTQTELRDYLNQYLPEDIAVLEVQEVSPRFHSRLNAAAKTYRYRIHTGPVPDVFSRRYVCPVAGTLDVTAMREAAGQLVGTHDFTSFCGNRRFKKSPVRTITEIRIEIRKDELDIWYTGDGFLQNMVRILTGTLVEVGQGRRPADSMAQALAAKNRDAAGITMPARGLALIHVFY